MRALPAILLVLPVAALALSPANARAQTGGPGEPPVWITGADGGRFRARFDPGHRLLVGAAVEATGGAGSSGGVQPVVELGLLLRAPPPPPDGSWDVAWTRDHELARLRLRPDGADALLYRGLYLRRSREGSLTLPTAPPVAIPLPFDIGLATELGRVRGLTWARGAETAGAASPRPFEAAGIVRGEVLADFLRSPHAGRWLLVGVGARYDVGFAATSLAAAQIDHLITPMTALSLAARGERRDGLLSAGARVEGAYRWSSRRGWELAARAEGELETTPLAVNDRPVSLFATATAEAGGGHDALEWRGVVGVRVSEMLR